MKLVLNRYNIKEIAKIAMLTPTTITILSRIPKKELKHLQSIGKGYIDYYAQYNIKINPFNSYDTVALYYLPTIVDELKFL